MIAECGTMKDSNKKNYEIRNPQYAIRDQKSGILYVVSTPIGNLEDITLRALKVLKSVDIIAAENVAHTRKLCKHYGIKTRLGSYNQHNQKVKAPELIKRLKSDSNIAIVTDAGTPGISDPGAYLINRANSEGIRVTPIPGPSAVIAALSVSGMPTEKFVFFTLRMILNNLYCAPMELSLSLFFGSESLRSLLQTYRSYRNL